VTQEVGAVWEWVGVEELVFSKAELGLNARWCQRWVVESGVWGKRLYREAELGLDVLGV
jgi:hypothetical protein